MKRFRKFRRVIVGAMFAMAVVGAGVSVAPREAKAISYECESWLNNPRVMGNFRACVMSIVYGMIDP